jgi:hypothetical protein
MCAAENTRTGLLPWCEVRSAEGNTHGEEEERLRIEAESTKPTTKNEGSHWTETECQPPLQEALREFVYLIQMRSAWAKVCLTFGVWGCASANHSREAGKKKNPPKRTREEVGRYRIGFKCDQPAELDKSYRAMRDQDSPSRLHNRCSLSAVVVLFPPCVFLSPSFVVLYLDSRVLILARPLLENLIWTCDTVSHAVGTPRMCGAAVRVGLAHGCRWAVHVGAAVCVNANGTTARPGSVVIARFLVCLHSKVLLLVEDEVAKDMDPGVAFGRPARLLVRIKVKCARGLEREPRW